MQFDSTAFNLDFSSAVTPKNGDDGTDDVSDDDSSIASDGSRITIETISPNSTKNDPTPVRAPVSPSTLSLSRNLALTDTPPDQRKKI